MPTPHEIYDEADQLKDQGKLPEALEKLEELLRQDDTHVLAHSASAVILGRLKRHEEAVAHARRVCELAPDDPFSFTALSVICQRAFAGTQNHAYIKDAEDAMARSRMLQAGH